MASGATRILSAAACLAVLAFPASAQEQERLREDEQPIVTVSPALRGSMLDSAPVTSPSDDLPSDVPDADTLSAETSTDPADLSGGGLREAFDRSIVEFSFEPGRRFLSIRRADIAPDDPYAPLGLRWGSFLLFPEFGVGAVHSDNILASSERPRSDTGLEINPRLRFQSGWSRHSLSGDFQTLNSWYREFDSENESSYDAILRGRIDVKRRTNLQLEATAARFQESRGSIDFPDAAAQPGDIEIRSLAGAFNHRFNRLNASLRGAVEEIDYSDAFGPGGGVIDNDDRDYRENELGLRLSYEFNPDLSAFTDIEANRRRFRRAIDDDGFRRDSDGWEAVAGLRFDLGAKIAGEVALGYALQDPKDRAFSDIDGVIVDADLTWRPTALTTFRFEARSAIEQTTTIDSAGALTRAYLLGIDHALRRNILLGGFLAYARSDYAGSDLVEVRRSAGIILEYRLNRIAAIESSWEHTHYDAGEIDSEYRENEFRIGMRFRR